MENEKKLELINSSNELEELLVGNAEEDVVAGLNALDRNTIFLKRELFKIKRVHGEAIAECNYWRGGVEEYHYGLIAIAGFVSVFSLLFKDVCRGVLQGLLASDIGLLALIIASSLGVVNALAIGHWKKLLFGASAVAKNYKYAFKVNDEKNASIVEKINFIEEAEEELKEEEEKELKKQEKSKKAKKTHRRDAVLTAS